MGALSATSESNTQNSIPGANKDEQALLKLFAQIAKQAGGQMGDLSKLASGDYSALGPTGADQELVSKSIGAARDMAARNAEFTTAEQQAQLGETLASKGIQGSSIESVQRALLQRDAQRQIGNNVDQATIEGGQALLNLPGQRAQIQLTANQELMNRLSGAGGVSLQSMLQARLAQGKQTTKTKSFDPTEWVKAGAAVGGAL